MKTRPITMLVCLLAASSIARAESELDRLKSSYEIATAKAVEPLKNTYAKELQKLLKRYAEAGRLDDAAKVMAEMKAIGVNPETGGLSAPANPGAKDRHFVGTTWKTPTGTSFEFLPDGKGTRSYGGADKTVFVWHARSGGIVEATGEASKGGKKSAWFFRFVSESEGYYGSAKDDIVTKLQRQP